MRQVHVVILTAIALEYQAAKQVDAGAWEGSPLVPLVEKYQPRCVAMCGVCAGHPRKTNLGDVIAPERLFFHDTGKRESDGVKHVSGCRSRRVTPGARVLESEKGNKPCYNGEPGPLYTGGLREARLALLRDRQRDGTL